MLDPQGESAIPPQPNGNRIGVLLASAIVISCTWAAAAFAVGLAWKATNWMFHQF